MSKGKKSQVWIETVVYTLIGLAIITLVLAVVKPKIDEAKDKAVIGQTIDVLNAIDMQIKDIRYLGEVRLLPDITIKRGVMNILPDKSLINFVIDDSSYQYSQLNKTINVGVISVLTEKLPKANKVTLTLNYSQYNITYNGLKQDHTLQKASQVYRLAVNNKGTFNGKINLDFTQIS